MARTHLPGLSVVINHHVLIEFISIKWIVVHGTKPAWKKGTHTRSGFLEVTAFSQLKLTDLEQ